MSDYYTRDHGIVDEESPMTQSMWQEVERRAQERLAKSQWESLTAPVVDSSGREMPAIIVVTQTGERIEIPHKDGHVVRVMNISPLAWAYERKG